MRLQMVNPRLASTSARWLLTGVEGKPQDGPIRQESEEVLRLARLLSNLDDSKVRAVMVLLGVKQGA